MRNMSKSLVLAGAVFLASAGVSRAQLTPEEAYARLNAKEAERQATKPTTQPTAQEVQDLRQALALLRAENTKLKKELAELRVKTTPVKATTAPAKGVAPAPAALPPGNQNLTPEEFVTKIHKGMTVDDANKFILSCHPKNTPLEFKGGDGSSANYYIRTVLCGQHTYSVSVMARDGMINYVQIASRSGY